MNTFSPNAAPSSVPVIDRVDINDFHRRWQAARVAALKQFTSPARPPDANDEVALLQQLPPERREEALKAVYSNTRKFGHSALRHFALLWDVEDVRAAFPSSAIPCAQGQWNAEGQRFSVTCRGCDLPQRCGNVACDYWNEAIDGLLMGLGDEVRHHRHRSAGHGDEFCLDVFAARSQEEFAYGPLPEHLVTFFATLEQRFAPEHCHVKFLGYAAGVVYYEATARVTGCGQKIWRSLLESAVAKTHPHLRLQDVSPTSVFAREDNDNSQE